MGHLELDGRNLPMDAVKAEGHSRYADFITLQHLHIADPQARVHELEAYPGWLQASYPGARIAPALLRTMDVIPP